MTYYATQTRKGLIAEALVADTLESVGILSLDWVSADYSLQTLHDVDLIGAVKIPTIRHLSEVQISIKHQEAGAKYGDGGEFGFELYEVRADNGLREYRTFKVADDYKVLAILQAGKVYVFTIGMVREYLQSKFGTCTKFPKTRGLTAKLRQALADSSYRYSDTISGYIDVADFVARQPVIVIDVEADKLAALELLGELNLSIDALRDTHYGVSLLRFVTTLTAGKTKATKRAMLDLIEQVTSLYA